MKYRKVWENVYGKVPTDEKGRSFEIHHIDGSRKNNTLENLQCLSIEEHYNLHLEQGDYAAANLIAKRLGKPTTRGFQGSRKGVKLTEEHKKALITSRIGLKSSKETKHRISEANKGREFTEEHKKKISESKKGIEFTVEHRRRLSESRKGKKYPQSKIICPHCLKEGGISGMKRRHFENCKNKKNLL